jgi:hypothetical protein
MEIMPFGKYRIENAMQNKRDTKIQLQTRTCWPTAWATSIFLLGTVALVTSLPTYAWAQTGNSTKKIRVQPNKSAIRVGTAIRWETDFETALEKSKAEGKPIFWYVPRLAETFMDRKTEIDRYMKAGPFSWPTMIQCLNENYIPLQAIPKKEQAKKYELVAYKFVEPGFLIINTAEPKVAKVDRISTMHQPWLESLIGAKPRESRSANLKEAWKLFANGKYDPAIGVLNVESEEDIDNRVESEILIAMAQFRANRVGESLASFEKIAKTYPDHPLAWKAAAEAQNIGPFVHGFEIHRTVPETAMLAGVDSAGSAAPPNTYTESQLWHRGIEYLLGMQHDNGGFFDSDYDFGGTDGLPNVHVAVSSIVGMALLEARLDDNLKDEHARIDAALKKIVLFVLDDTHINTQDSDELIWAYLYRQRFVNALLRVGRLDVIVAKQTLAPLESMQTASGAWFHEYNNPFVTASCLWAMNESKSLGIEVDASKVEAGLASLQGSRFQSGAYSYGTSKRSVAEKPGRDRDTIAGAGRMPLCEGALFAWERSSDDLLLKSLNISFEKHDSMAKALKYDDHTSEYGYGGFFFWYDMQARCDAIEKVTDARQRAEFAKRQRELIMALPEIDGCFIDSHEIGRCYGTGMALICLKQCERAMKVEE